MPEIDPWGDVELGEYREKMEKFGIEPVDEISDQLPDHRYVSRGILFGHRGMGEYLESLHDGDDVAAITGIMPSGEMHMGHKVVVETMKMFQDMGAKLTITVADIEAYNTREMSLEDARKLAMEQFLTNYIALGIDIDEVDFYFQSRAGNEHHSYSKKFARYLTQNEVEATYGSAEPAKITSALTQYADILRPQFDSPKPTVVPIGIDQDPHMRLTREVATKFKDRDFKKPASICNKFMRGLNGGKMSSSDPKSYIALTDSVDEAKKKIENAKTGGQDSLDEHRSKGADIEEDMVFELLAFHLVESNEKLDRIRKEYEGGEMLSGEIKEIAKDRIEEFLLNHQEARESAEEKVDQLMEERPEQF